MNEARTLIEGLMFIPLPFAPCPLPLAAVPDAWLIGLPVALMVVQIVVLVVQGVVVSKLGEIGKLKSELTATTKELIDTRFIGVTHQIGEISQRLGWGEDMFDKLRAADSALKVEVIERLAALQEKCATKEDVREIKQLITRTANS